MKSMMVLMVAAAMVVGFAAQSHASYEMEIWDSAGQTLIVPSSAGEAIQIGGSLGSWTFGPQNVGIDSADLGGGPSMPEMELNFSVESSPATAGAWLKIAVSETGFTTGPVQFYLSAGTIYAGNGTQTNQLFWDSTDTLFGNAGVPSGTSGTAIASIGPNAGVLDSTIDSSTAGNALYSLTDVVTFTEGSSGGDVNGGGDSSVSETPIPGAVFLLAPGLAGLVALRRRKYIG